MEINQSTRFESLDWLRGLMSISIMLYHYGVWIDVSQLLSRLGIYAVSIFFCLSGLSMGIAYGTVVINKFTTINFYLRRIARIWPLLWFAVALVVLPTAILGRGPHNHEPYGLKQIFLNLTTLAAYFNNGGYINVGAWSIGNEMFFYLLTPPLIYIFQKKRQYGNYLTLFSILICFYYAFIILDNEKKLSFQFDTYSNPLNNFFFYLSGLAIYFNFNSYKPSKYISKILPLVVILLFTFFPAQGDQVIIVTGWNRIIFSAISILAVFVFFVCHSPDLPQLITSSLAFFGLTSYGVYLLHPIVAWYIDGVFDYIELVLLVNKLPYFRTLFSLALTMYFSAMTYKYLEMPFIIYAKRVLAIKK